MAKEIEAKIREDLLPKTVKADAKPNGKETDVEVDEEAEQLDF